LVYEVVKRLRFHNKTQGFIFWEVNLYIMLLEGRVFLLFPFPLRELKRMHSIIRSYCLPSNVIHWIQWVQHLRLWVTSPFTVRSDH